jgi:Fic/DOC family/Ring finger domain
VGRRRSHAINSQRIRGRVVVGGTTPPAPEEVESQLETVLKMVMRGGGHVRLVAWAFVTFEGIHCYSDGNGRVGRALIAALMMWFGYLQPPELDGFVSGLWERRKDLNMLLAVLLRDRQKDINVLLGQSVRAVEKATELAGMEAIILEVARAVRAVPGHDNSVPRPKVCDDSLPARLIDGLESAIQDACSRFRGTRSQKERQQPLKPVLQSITLTNQQPVETKTEKQEEMLGDCPICASSLDDLHEADRFLTPCKHTFCVHCLSQWESRDHVEFRCPLCRANLHSVRKHLPVHVTCDCGKPARECHEHEARGLRLASSGSDTESSTENDLARLLIAAERFRHLASETRQVRSCSSCSNKAALDCSDQRCGGCCSDYHCPRHGTPGADAGSETEADTEAVSDTEVQEIFCDSCSNKAALDCSQQRCGGCCSDYHCSRHGTPGADAGSETEADTEAVSDTEVQEIFCDSCSNKAALDCSQQRCGGCCSDYHCSRHGTPETEDYHCSRHGTPETEAVSETEAEADTEETWAAEPEEIFCDSCSNKAAQDCSFSCCGRCCPHLNCVRHG